MWGPYTTDSLKKTQQLLSGCCSRPGVWRITASCLPGVGRRQTLTALHHHYSTHQNPTVLGLFSRAAHRQLSHPCWLSPLQVSIQCGHSYTVLQLNLWISDLFTFSYRELGICLSNPRLVFWNLPLLKHGFSVKFFDLHWAALGQSSIALCYFSALLVAVPWFFWMGQEKVVAGLVESKY